MRRAGDQTNGRVENGLQVLNVAVGETSEYNVTVVKPTVYQVGDHSGQCMCRQRPIDGSTVICLRAMKQDDNTWLSYTRPDL